MYISLEFHVFIGRGFSFLFPRVLFFPKGLFKKLEIMAWFQIQSDSLVELHLILILYGSKKSDFVAKNNSFYFFSI